MELKAQANLESLLALAFLLSVVAIFVFSVDSVKSISRKGIEGFQSKVNVERCALMVDALYSNSVYAELESECPLGEKGGALTREENLEVFHLEKGVVTGVEPSKHYR